MTGQAAGTAGDGGLQDWGRHKGGAGREAPFPVGPHGNRMPEAAAVQEVGLPVKAKEEGARETPPAQRLPQQAEGEQWWARPQGLGFLTCPSTAGELTEGNKGPVTTSVPENQLRWEGWRSGRGFSTGGPMGPQDPASVLPHHLGRHLWHLAGSGCGGRRGGLERGRRERPGKSRCAAGCGPTQAPCPDGRPKHSGEL